MARSPVEVKSRSTNTAPVSFKTVFVDPSTISPASNDPGLAPKLDLTIVVPTRNESGNVAPLLARIDPVIGHLSAEVIFVDDSTDGTPDVITAEVPNHVLPVRLIHRQPEQRTGGLGGAVLEGMRAARGHWIVVMDGDLQHPPELLPTLFTKALDEHMDLVIASRYCDDGSASSFNAIRSFVSRGSTIAAKAMFPRRLHNVDDPMTGFFLIRRDAIDLDALQPNGFKILLEIVARTPRLRIGSVPFEFGERHSGESKASIREGFRFLSLLLSLRMGPWLTRFTHFGLVGVSGLVVNTLALAFFTETVGLFYMMSLLLATQASTLWNFGLSEYWVFKDMHRNGGQNGRAVKFFAMNNLALLGRGPIVFGLTSLIGMNYLLSNVISMAVLLVLRYILADSLIWKVNTSGSSAMPLAPQQQEAVR